MALCVLLGAYALSQSLLFLVLVLPLSGRRRGARPAEPVASLDILIPAHDEEGRIGGCLASLGRALDAAGSAGLSTRVLVAAGDCSDATAFEARAAAAEVIEVSERDKWSLLRQLIGQSRAEWMALVDADAIWPSDLITRFGSEVGATRLDAWAPACECPEGGLFYRCAWAFERQAKHFENAVGGSSALNGPTIFYRRESLLKALDWLGPGRFINDDVVIPLAIKAANPSARLHYAAAARVSCVARARAGAFTRRRRMSCGNLEWMRRLWPRLVAAAPDAGLLSLRQSLRVFWVWPLIVVFFAVPQVLKLPVPLALGLGLTALASLEPAARASFCAPFWLLRSPFEALWR